MSSAIFTLNLSIVLFDLCVSVCVCVFWTHCEIALTKFVCGFGSADPELEAIPHFLSVVSSRRDKILERNRLTTLQN